MPKKSLPQFRRAVHQDIDAMSTIRLAVKENVLSNPDGVTRKMYEDYLDVLGRGWVAEIDGVIVAFSYANGTDSSIWALFVAPGYEARGLAKQLLDLATSWLFEQGNQRVNLSTGAHTRANGFYAAQGWTRERVDGNNAYFSMDRVGRDRHGQSPTVPMGQ